MPNKTDETEVCQICKKRMNVSELLSGELVRRSYLDAILKKYPGWTADSYICHSCRAQIREDVIKGIIKEDVGEITNLENDVIKSLREQDLLSKNVDAEFEKKLTLGDKLSDKMAEFGGSWSFVIFFLSLIFIWIIINTYLLVVNPYDPYPYILLNLILSCVAALQAPVIMMSQNRQEARDRMRSEQDYRVNLKAELQIRLLNEKIDHLLTRQWQRLMEIQDIQMELMEELAQRPCIIKA